MKDKEKNSYWDNLSKGAITKFLNGRADKTHPSRYEIPKLIKDLSAKSILEIACGVGGNLEKILEYKELSQLEYVGIDRTQQFIDKCKSKFPNQKFLLYDIYDLPFSVEHAFDFVFARHIIEHLPECDEALSNMMKMSSKYFVLINFLNNLEDENIIAAKDGWYINQWSRKMIRDRFTCNGFKVIKEYNLPYPGRQDKNGWNDTIFVGERV